MKEVLPYSPAHHSSSSSNQVTNQGHGIGRGGNHSPHHKESANNLAKSDLNIVSLKSYVG